MRLFAAIAVPAIVTERLLQLRLRLATPKDGLRWSEPEQWHVTLRWFGDVSGSAATALQEALRSLVADAPEIHLAELGLFPVKGILFASVAPSPQLLAVQAQVERLASATGLMPETRPFHPHITLARSRGKAGFTTLRQLAQPTLPALGGGMRWKAREVILYESDLAPTGAVYEALERFPLHPSEA